MDFLKILCEAEIHTSPKLCGKWSMIARERYGKTRTFQIDRFHKYFE